MTGIPYGMFKTGFHSVRNSLWANIYVYNRLSTHTKIEFGNIFLSVELLVVVTGKLLAQVVLY